MTGPTLVLTRWQRDELRLYESGILYPGRHPSTNLIRRGMVRPISGGPQKGAYVLTGLGRAALALPGEQEQ